MDKSQQIVNFRSKKKKKIKNAASPTSCFDSTQRTLETLPKKLQALRADEIQSLVLELCGRKEPHLVRYDFDIDLKPLFYTLRDGSIRPALEVSRFTICGNSSHPYVARAGGAAQAGTVHYDRSARGRVQATAAGNARSGSSLYRYAMDVF